MVNYVRLQFRHLIEVCTIRYLISIGWFHAWKNYVDSLDTDASSPGPIDNSSITSSEDSLALRNGLIDGQDYELLPEAAYKILENSYGGGPSIFRTIYPLPFKIFVSNSSADDSISPTDKPSLVLSLSLTSTIDDVSKKLSDALELPQIIHTSNHLDKKPSSNNEMITNFSAVRFWSNVVYATYESPASSTAIESQKAVDITLYNENEILFSGRRWTTEVTDTVDGWTYMRSVATDVKISTLFPNAKLVNLLLELSKEHPITSRMTSSDKEYSLTAKPASKPYDTVSSVLPIPVSWPRERHLNRWQDSIAVGDIVDAVDRENKWYEAKIVQISSEGDGFVQIHYFGWGEKFDVKVKLSEVPRMLQPLYSQTTNWRDRLQVNDDVEIKSKDQYQTSFKWHEARVLRVNAMDRTVDVEYSSSSSGSSKKTVFMYGEEICAYGTHIKPKPKPSLPAASTALTYSYNSSPESRSTSSLGLARSGGSSYGGGGGWYSTRSHTRGTPLVCGVVGLQNLGNTCFMASMLQCLSNTRTLTEVFLGDEYKADINTDNPLGKGGKIANVYAKLIRDMWSNQYTVVVPDEFKHVIGEFASQFAGYQQQDSQEFMCFLLDGLHEDLNRVRKKSFVTAIESKGRPDELISREAWRRYILRNDSYLVDSFFGLSKSHVTCTGCRNESVTFEPFNSLSLPIPVKNVRNVDVTVFPLPLGSPPLKTVVEVPVTATIRELKELLKTVLAARLRPASQGKVVQKSESGSLIEDPADMTTFDMSSPMETADASGPGNESESSSVTLVSDASINSSGGDTKEYVLVDKEDMDNAGTTGVAMELDVEDLGSSPAVLTDDSQIVEVSDCDIQEPAPVFLHACCQFSYYSQKGEQFNRLGRTFQDHLYVREMQKHELLVVFQQHHHVKAKNLQSSYSYGGMHGSRADDDFDKESPGDSAVASVVDVQIGVLKPNKMAMSSHPQTTYQLIAPVHRVSILQSTHAASNSMYSYNVKLDEAVSNSQDVNADSVTTNADIHAYVWEINSAMIHDDSPYSSPENKPYEIFLLSPANITSSAVSSCKPLPNDSKPFHILPHECIACVWNLTAYTQDHHDETAFEAVSVPGNVSTTSESFTLTLQDCLDKYMEREQLAEEQTIYCSKCKQHLAPLKKMDIWTAPEILILQLKRFQYIPGYMFVQRDKITDLVQFPIEGLDLSRYVRGEGLARGGSHPPSPPPIYDLYAVSEHSGGLGGGHYTAVCKNFKDNKWYDFNDSHVSETVASAAVSPRAYVLFYKRRGVGSDAAVLAAGPPVDKISRWRWGGISLDEPTGLEDERE